jgi:putative phage-type endonuclease
LGGSDAAAIVGVSPYRGPLDVWARFHMPVEDQESEPAIWGNVLEEPIAREYARRQRVEIATVDTTVRHPEHPWMLANPDRLIVGARRGLEVKTAGVRQAHRWGEGDGSDAGDVPDEYRLQVAHYMAVFGFDAWDLAVLIGGQDFRIYRITRDRELESMLIEAEREFWERHVVTGVQPAADASPNAEAWVSRLYPRNTLPPVEATDERVRAATEYDRARAEADAADERKTAASARLRSLIGESEGFRWGAKSKATWTNNKGGAATDWQAIARDLASGDVPEHLIQKHTTIKPGPRVLRVTVKE